MIKKAKVCKMCTNSIKKEGCGSPNESYSNQSESRVLGKKLLNNLKTLLVPLILLLLCWILQTVVISSNRRI